MALASAPSTPERGAAPYLVRRSFTAPIKSTRTSSPLREAAVAGAETLYVHPSGKIVSFSSNSSKLVRRHSSVSDTKSDFQDEVSGSLPWASITERTIAAGPLQIYRVLGSVAFLNSGNILHPVLAKSQCWCVDGVSKFVLRIRPNTYYRIELPNESSQDEEKVEELKKVLPSILQYEVTPCPFKRGFTVDLPEAPATPVQKRPWRPKLPVRPSAQDVTEELDELDEMEESNEHTSKERYPEDIGVFHGPPEESNYFPSSLGTSITADTTVAGTTDSETPNEARSEARRETVKPLIMSIEDKKESVSDEPLNFKTPTRPKALRTGRTVTAPPQLSLQTSPPSTATGAVPPPRNLERELSVSSSIESFHSFHSPISPLPPSPPTPNSSPEAWANGIDLAKVRRHTRDTSDVTVTATQPERWDMADDWSGDGSAYDTSPDLPHTPTFPNECNWSEAVQATPKQVRLRQKSATATLASPFVHKSLFALLSSRPHVRPSFYHRPPTANLLSASRPTRAAHSTDVTHRCEDRQRRLSRVSLWPRGQGTEDPLLLGLQRWQR